MEVLYFAWVREGLGIDGERVEPPVDVVTIADLVAWLAGRGGDYAEIFSNSDRIRAAIDQHFVQPDAAIAGAREIALFPPVTGG